MYLYLFIYISHYSRSYSTRRRQSVGSVLVSVHPSIEKSVKQFAYSFAVDAVPLCGMLFLMRFVHLLPSSERSLNPISTPRYTHLNLNIFVVFLVVLDPFSALT